MTFHRCVQSGILVALLTVASLGAQAPTGALTLTATPASAAGETVKINIMKWSTSEQQDALLTAIAPPPPPAAPAAGAPAAAAQAPAAQAAAPAAPFNPMKSLEAALEKSPTIGMVWTSENTGYSVKYAYRAAQPDGSERIILATSRRIVAWAAAPQSGTAPDFTIIEMKLDSRGGEAKSSVNARVVVDLADKTLALANYSAAPVVLKDIKK